MTPALPDVNVLLALAWPNHQFHAPARRWFAGLVEPWATCAVTELGFVRLSSNPAFTPHARTPHEAVLLLAAMKRHPQHRYLSESAAVTGDVFTTLAPRLQGHRQVTDVYLLAMAAHHQSHLVTFDTRVRAIAADDVMIELLPME